MFKLLSTANPKTQRGVARGYMTYVLHLAPYTLSGRNVCPKATAGCIASCLNTAGRGGMFKPGETTNKVQQARLRRTEFWNTDPEGFLLALADDIRRAEAQAARRGLKAVFRLNATSDISWEKHGIIEQFPHLQFYDYTKVLGRKVQHLPNYHLTFSRAENNEQDVAAALEQGMNVAVVFDKVPDHIYNADATDLRFLDGAQGVIGVRAKGPARRDQSGFVIRLVEA